MVQWLGGWNGSGMWWAVLEDEGVIFWQANMLKPVFFAQNADLVLYRPLDCSRRSSNVVHSHGDPIDLQSYSFVSRCRMPCKEEDD